MWRSAFPAFWFGLCLPSLQMFRCSQKVAYFWHRNAAPMYSYWARFAVLSALPAVGVPISGVELVHAKLLQAGKIVVPGQSEARGTT